MSNQLDYTIEDLARAYVFYFWMCFTIAFLIEIAKQEEEKHAILN